MNNYEKQTHPLIRSKELTFTSSYIVDTRFARLRSVQGLHVSIYEICHMNIISYACSILGIVIRPLDLKTACHNGQCKRNRPYWNIVAPKQELRHEWTNGTLGAEELNHESKNSLNLQFWNDTHCCIKASPWNSSMCSKFRSRSLS